MKITHIAIACFYIEGWTYQENLLPKFHKKLGYDVSIVTSRFNKDEQDVRCLRDAGEYVSGDGIPVTILDYGTPTLFQKLLRARPVVGLFEKLMEIKPDIVFVHGSQFYNIFDVIKYRKLNPSVKVFADQHGDYYNMPVNTWKEKIMQRVVFGHYARSIAKYTDMFWGVTPWRVHYLQNVYKIRPEKTGLLIMGADDEKIDFSNQSQIRKEFRDSVGIEDTDFLIVTGGKIDETKNIHLLMQAVTALAMPAIKLVIFGTPNDGIREKYDRLLAANKNIISIGWIKSEKAYGWFLSADLVVFPGTHSVLWEQAVACGVPVIFKKWEGMQHVDVGGNCMFLTQDSPQEIANVISEIYNNTELYARMKHIAMEKGTKEFRYSEIAKRSIGLK